MDVVFRTNHLARCYEESQRAIQEWGPVVGRRYIDRINQLFQLEDFREAYSIASLRLHSLHGSRTGQLSIYLTGRWRLIAVRGDTERSVIIEEVSNHYDD